MKILALTNLYPSPGRPNFAAYNRQQFRALAGAHELTVIAPVPWTEWLARPWDVRASVYRNADGVDTCHPCFAYTPGVLRHRYGEFLLASVAPTVRRIAAEFGPDVILSSWAHPDGWAAARLGQQLGVPVVTKVVGTDILGAAKAPRRRVRIAEALTAADAVVVVSEDLAGRVIGLGVDAGRVHIVHEGLDLGLFRLGDRAEARNRLGLPGDRPIVLFVGNLLLSKGAGVLVDACKILEERGVEFLSVMVGQGRDEKKVRAMIAKRGLEGRVMLVGPRPHRELPDWYWASDLVALPSFSEGIPNVLREAAACGRPYVATNVGGIPEIADLGINRLVPPGDAGALADAMGELLAARTEPREVAARSRSVSWQESAGKLAGVLQGSLKADRPPAPERSEECVSTRR